MGCNWGFKGLNGTQQLLIYVDDVNIFGGSKHKSIIKKTESLAVSSKEIGLEVNIDKTKYMIMPGDQNAERSHNID